MRMQHDCKPLELQVGVVSEVPFRETVAAGGSTNIDFAFDEGQEGVFIDAIFDVVEMASSGLNSSLYVSGITYNTQAYFPRTKSTNTGANVETGFALAGMNRAAVLDYGSGCCQTGALDSPGSPLAHILRKIGKMTENKVARITVTNADGSNAGTIQGSLLVKRTA